MKILITILVIIFFIKDSFAQNLESQANQLSQKQNHDPNREVYFEFDESIKASPLLFSVAVSHQELILGNESHGLRLNKDSIRCAFDKTNTDQINVQWDTRLIHPQFAELIGKNGNLISTFNIGNQQELSFKSKDVEGDFKICLKVVDDRESATLCSQYYQVKNMQLDVPDLNSEFKILVNNEVVQKSIDVTIHDKKVFLFYVQLKNGIIYDLKTSVRDFQFNGYQYKDSKFSIFGQGSTPLSENIRRVASEQNNFIDTIGFSSTIKTEVETWYAHSSQKQIELLFQGKLGGVFKISLQKLDDLETPNLTYKNEHMSDSTYLYSYTIDLIDPDKKQISLTQSLDKVAEKNNLSFDLNYNDKNYKIHKEVYHLTDQELSFRGFIIPTSARTVLLSELSYSQWFETFFGIESYYLSKQRWGLQFKLNQSLNQFEVKDDGKVVEEKMSSSNIDLKYRFSPGTWGRDETVGLILSHQQVQLGDYKLSEAGVGLFWARSMPQVFDDLFNLIPFLRYPKWVDMEFINYSQVLNSDENESTGSNMNLNFHGKIFWNKTVFGEAGFGIKKYDFRALEDQTRFNFSTVYGSVGLGINF